MFESKNGDFDIQKKHINNKGVNVITAGIGNNGILGKSDVDARIFNEKTITVDMFGYCFYRNFKYKMVTHARVFSLIPKIEISDRVGIFLSNSLSYISKKFGYENMCSFAKIQNENIQLPTKNREIDFQFMEDFVAELEAQRVAELEAYLTVTGLKDYELTEEEENALEIFANLEWREFSIGDLFEIKPTKAYKYTNKDLFQKQGMYPVVTNSSINNGITGYTNLLPTEQGNMITYSDTTTSEGIFYQPRDFVGYSHIQGLYPILNKEKWNYYSLIYFVTHFKKCAEGKFDYGNKFNRRIASSMITQLPAKDGKIDFEYMETLISAIQKLVIKDVVLWADKKIDATKQVIHKN